MERLAALVGGGLGFVLLTLGALATVATDPQHRTGPAALRLRVSTLPLEPTLSSLSTLSPTTNLANDVPPVHAVGSVAPSGPTTTSPAAPTTVVSGEFAVLVQRINSGQIRFEFQRSELSPAAARELDKLAALLVVRPDTLLEIDGHTDAIGGAEMNEELSLARAQVVLDYLIRAGVAPRQLQAAGHGARQPIADNTSDAGRAANRRSDVSVKGGQQ